MSDIDLKFTDNSAMILKELERKTEVALTKIGTTAEGYAKKQCPVGDTGRLKNSITNTVIENDCYIGTNVEYAMWQELGTGIYASDGKGRKSPWAYKDSKGVWHNTRGVKPKHFLKNAAANHTEEYKQILKDTLADK